MVTGNNATSPLQNLTISSGPLTAGNHASVSPVLPLRFPGAPLTGPAGLPFVLSTMMSLLSQTGALPTSQPAPGTSAGAPINLALNLASRTSNVTAVANAGTGNSLTLGNVSTGTTIGTITSVITATTGINIAGAGIITLTSANYTFTGPIVLRAGSLILAVEVSLNEADPGTAFSESNPVSLIDSASGALFPVNTNVKVNGLMSPSASSPTATIVNQSSAAMIVKRTSTGGLSFMRVAAGGVIGPP